MMNQITEAEQAVDPITASASELRAAFADGVPVRQVLGSDRPLAVQNIKVALVGIHPDIVVGQHYMGLYRAKRCYAAWVNGRAHARDAYYPELSAWLYETAGSQGERELALISALA